VAGYTVDAESKPPCHHVAPVSGVSLAAVDATDLADHITRALWPLGR
jgi:hypothetical protein